MPLKLPVNLKEIICYTSQNAHNSNNCLLRVSTCICQWAVNLLKHILRRFKIIYEKFGQDPCIQEAKSKNQSSLHHESYFIDDLSFRVEAYESRPKKFIFKERNPYTNLNTPRQRKFIDTKESVDSIRLTVYRGICSINEKIQKYQYLYSGKGVQLNPEGNDALLVSNQSVISKLRVNLFAFDDTDNVDVYPPVIIGESKIGDERALSYILNAHEDIPKSDGEDEYSDGEQSILTFEQEYNYDCDRMLQQRNNNVSAMLEIFFVGKDALMLRRRSIGHRRLHGIILLAAYYSTPYHHMH